MLELIMATEAVVMATDLEIDRYLQPIEVVNYFVDKVSSSNHDLIKHFRPLLVKSSLGPDNHAILKKITAQLVIVKRIQGKASFSSRYLAVLRFQVFRLFFVLQSLLPARYWKALLLCGRNRGLRYRLD